MNALGPLADSLATVAHKGFREGTERTVPPDRTLATVRPLMRRLGITRVANVTGLDSVGIPVAVAIRPNARSLSTSQGKGLTVTAAKVSALMEAAELFHAERATLPLKLASYEELVETGHPLADVKRLPRSPRRRFTRRLSMPWVEALNLLDGTTRWLPFELVHTNYTLPPRLSTGAFNATSNGLASGNHVLEAVVQGICEVVERDATTLWSQLGEAERAARRLNLATVDDGDCLRLLERFEQAGVVVGVWHTTTDVGLPSFVCTIVDREPSPLRPIHAASGMGCHLNRRIALLRALTEAAQSRLTMTTGSRDDVPREDYERLQSTQLLERLRNRVTAGGPSASYADVPTTEHATFNDDLDRVLANLHGAGVTEILAVDLQRPELGVPVVRVVIPGLEGMIESDDYVRGGRARVRVAGAE